MVSTNTPNSTIEYIKVDYAISVGSACRPAHYLRKYGIRRCSNPLDWMMGYSLDTIINLFKNDFNNFFTNRKEHSQKAGNRFKYIEDTTNGIISIHSFPLDTYEDSVYDNFYETMKRRYDRMKECISRSDSILFVSCRDEPIENFEKFLIEIRKMFKCKCIFLNIRNINKKQEIKKKITSELEIIDYSICDIHPEGSTPDNPEFWTGNPEEWGKIMQKIKLTTKLSHLMDVSVVDEDRLQK